jgi:5'-methylthioadenosine phosphorylase
MHTRKEPMMDVSRQPHLAVIGGTGVYDIESLVDVEEIDLQTPYGSPSDRILVGTLAGLRVAFLARHGHGHRLLPSEVPYRANIWALKYLGVSAVVSISACGSMKETYGPGSIVVPDQLFDFTRSRDSSFFGEGLVAHIGFAEPFCNRLRLELGRAVEEAAGTVHLGGTYLIIEGPRFSSKGESLIFRQWGVDIIGMTIAPEAQLAREAELCYAVMAHVTDYDCWHESESAVSVDLVMKTLEANAQLATRTIMNVARRLQSEPRLECACHEALRTALLTATDRVPSETKLRLYPIIAKYL